jgi:hypothetical protein
LTVEDLMTLAKSFQVHFPHISPSLEALQYFLAAQILRIALGDSWCDHQLGGNPKAHQRLQMGADYVQRMKAQLWTVQLAEILLNLQDVPGFDNRLRRLLRDNLESAVSELEAARLLTISCLPFEFVEESGRRGYDYEALVQLPTGDLGACEVKRKVGSSAPRLGSIYKSLSEGVGQIPSDLPGILFLQVPEGWIVAGDQLSTAVEGAIGKLFRNSSRVIAVVVFWEEWHLADNGALLRLVKYREWINEQSRFYDALDPQVFSG